MQVVSVADETILAPRWSNNSSNKLGDYKWYHLSRSLVFDSHHANSISIQDTLVDQSNVALTKYIKWLSRFVAPKLILLILFITASNLSTIGIDSSTSTSLLIALIDSPSSNALSRSWTLSDRQYIFLVFTSLVLFSSSRFHFETIDNTSLLFSSSLLLRRFFSVTSTSAHGPRREQRCCFLVTPQLHLSAFFYLYFTFCIVYQRAVWCKTWVSEWMKKQLSEFP